MTIGNGGLPDHADLDQPVEIRISLFSPVVDETVLLVEPVRPRVVFGHPQLSRSPTEGVVKEGLSDTLSVAERQDVQREELLIAHGRVSLVLDRWTVHDKADNLISLPGDADPLPSVVLRESTRPHLPPGLAGAVVVEALR